MKLRDLFIIPSLLLALTPTLHAQNQLVTYPAPQGAELKKDFIVQVREPGKEWKAIDTYSVKVDEVREAKHNVELASLSYFDFAGEDKPKKGTETLFNISVNSTKLYTEGLNRNKHGLFEVVYPIPASAQPLATQTMEFSTLHSMPHPFTIHTKKGWQEMCDKAEKHDWARVRKAKYLQDAEQWAVPVRPPYAANADGDPYLCATTNEHDNKFFSLTKVYYTKYPMYFCRVNTTKYDITIPNRRADTSRT